MNICVLKLPNYSLVNTKQNSALSSISEQLVLIFEQLVLRNTEDFRSGPRVSATLRRKNRPAYS